MHRPLLLLIVAAALPLACNTPGARLNAPPHGQACKTSDLQGTFTYMVDNALLADMTVSDHHFLPHRAALNDLGRARLGRLASLLEAYGGTIRLNTDLTDEELIAGRTQTVVDFLAEAGIDTSRQVVVCDLPGGEGMSAKEAILIKVNEGTYKPQQRGTSSSAGGTAVTK